MAESQYVGAKLALSPFYNRPGKPRAPRVIVIHTAECGESSMAAENVAGWFKDPRAKVSAHYTVDNDSIVQSVLEGDVAWHASQANGYSIGIELAGKAGQSVTDWADAYSLAVLDRAATLVASLCKKYSIAAAKLVPGDLKLPNARGICGHVDVSNAYTPGRGHFDPGPNFDWPAFIALIKCKM